eukprot:CAMPEP_0115376680 /NCGR_PEP_ID=MMETSP0271-20121206/3100_1 /TAXON_ID=71861 /ORGANISM="Scrippsiella trochoidea, Strain CCMP3099" /LENGTH=319 /DNA_ID=CAMNT_0002799777 /DNA_START=55 /DNA_END=1011 /DNA_ORIENTATION=-
MIGVHGNDSPAVLGTVEAEHGLESDVCSAAKFPIGAPAEVLCQSLGGWVGGHIAEPQQIGRITVHVEMDGRTYRKTVEQTSPLLRVNVNGTSGCEEGPVECGPAATFDAFGFGPEGPVECDPDAAFGDLDLSPEDVRPWEGDSGAGGRTPGSRAGCGPPGCGWGRASQRGQPQRGAGAPSCGSARQLVVPEMSRPPGDLREARRMHPLRHQSSARDQALGSRRHRGREGGLLGVRRPSPLPEGPQGVRRRSGRRLQDSHQVPRPRRRTLGLQAEFPEVGAGHACRGKRLAVETNRRIKVQKLGFLGRLQPLSTTGAEGP